MKKLISIIAAMAIIFTLAGCSNGTESAVNTSAEATTTDNAGSTDTADTTTAADSTDLPDTTDAPQSSENSSSDFLTYPEPTADMTEDQIYDLMVERSLMTTGNIARTAKALKKAENGEEITVAYIGGSITEGLTAGAELCWAKLSYDWLCEKYPQAKINFVNAGLSGTPSALGIVRSERDICAYDPDIVFVEFAVNDGQDAVMKESYESLVRTFLNSDKQTAVVLLITVLKNGYSCQEHMSQVGAFYDLPVISVGNAINPEFEAGRMVWEDYSDDESHPNVYGHTVVRDFVANYYEKVIEQMSTGEIPEISPVTDETLFGNSYEGMHFADSASITIDSLGDFEQKTVHEKFPNGWVHREGTNPFTFKLTCKNLFIVFRANNSPRYGSVDVLIDGEKYAVCDSNRSDGWNQPQQQWIFNSDSVEEHTFEIVPSEGSEDLYFNIFGFGYCD